MLARLKSAASKAFKWIGGLFLLAFIAYALTCPRYETVHPIKPVDFKRVAAQVNTAGSRGSGVVLRSDSGGTDVLTAKHVCANAVVLGSFVYVNREKHLVDSIKPSFQYDLCLVHTKDVLYLSVDLAKVSPKFGDVLRTAGHPLSMPLLFQEGRASETFNILPKDAAPEKLFLMLTNILVQPGQSGSGVFDEEGNLVGIMVSFKTVYPKGPPETIGFGLAIPRKHVEMFLEKEAPGLPYLPVPDASGF